MFSKYTTNRMRFVHLRHAYVSFYRGKKMSSAVERTEEHLREYLTYRGFTSTLKTLDAEVKADKEKGFRVCISVADLIIRATS